MTREPLLAVALEPAAAVGAVEAQRITFGPGQRSPRHTHPCPVVGVVLDGEFIYELEGGTVLTLRAGDAFLEPADAVVVRFDNASAAAPATFVAQYLLAAPGGPTVVVL